MGAHTLAEFEDALRAPLSALATAAQMLGEAAELGEPDKVHELLAIVRQNADVLDRLIDELSERTRIEGDKLVLELGEDELRTIRSACAAPSPPPRPEPAESGAPLVLVADDESSTRLLISTVLRQKGYRVVEAENGLEALHIVEQQRPAILILDGHMPELDGLEVCKRSKALDPAYSPRTMIVTAVFKALWYRHQALSEIGVDEFMTKPVRMDELIARVERLTR